MTRTFIQTYEFSTRWEKAHYDDTDLQRLEQILLENPKAGAVIPGTGRLRKLRFAAADSGKRGGVRVCYVDYVLLETIYFITVYSKKEKSDLSAAERRNIARWIDELEMELQKRNSKGR